MERGVSIVSWGMLVASLGLVALHLLPRLQLMSSPVLIAASLIPYGVPASAVALSLLALARARPLVLLLSCAVLTAHILIARPYWPGQAPASSDPITVMTMNMRCNSPGHEALAQLILDSDPGVIVINGLGRKSRLELTETLADRYSTAAFTPMPAFPECGTVVFTRLPFDGWVSTQRHPTAFVRAPGFEFALGIR